MSNFSKNGQLLPAIRKPLFDKVVKEQLGAFTLQPNGELVMQLGTIEGKPVSAVVKLSISTRTNFDKKERTKVVEEQEEIDVNSLFD